MTTNFQTCIAQITEWGRDHVSPRTGVATDTGGHFSENFTEYVRRELRSMAIDDTTGKVTGSWRNGYRLHLSNDHVYGESVGVGKMKGNGFVVFYSPVKPCPICGRVDENHLLDQKHS